MGGEEPVDTSTAVGKMILTVLMAAETMNVQLMKEKQKICIARAKKEGKYKGKRQSQKTIAACNNAIKKINKGYTKEDAAKAEDVGIATLYRYIKQHGLTAEA